MRVFLLIILFSASSFGMRIHDNFLKASIVSSHGYEINPAQTNWILAEAKKRTKNKIDVLFRLKDADKKEATFSVRIDKDTEAHSLNDYGKKWLKAYGQFGIEVLGHKYFKNELGQRGLVVDIANHSSHKRVRQVIFFKENNAAILTCMDLKNRFQSTIKDCNQLIKGFSWIEPATPSQQPNLEEKI